MRILLTALEDYGRERDCLIEFLISESSCLDSRKLDYMPGCRTRILTTTVTQTAVLLESR